MKFRTSVVLAAAAALVLSCAGEARSATPQQRPRTIVLELFTSQGCSSCPPADRLLSRLQREGVRGRTVIPLAYHVDYWDHLGWRDPFSASQWSQRQRDYAAALHEPQVYTPELVVNGSAPLVGSSEGAIRREIDRQLEEEDRGAIVIDRVARSGAGLTVDVHASLDAPGSANVVVVLYEDGVTTSVARGENANRVLVNDAIVRWQQRALVLNAKDGARVAKVSIPLDPVWRAEHLGVAAFLQDPSSLAIYAGTSRPASPF
jgi:hypothetical protein